MLIMIKYKMFFGFILAQVTVLVCLFVYSIVALDRRGREVQDKRELVSSLMLTDLSLWTGAPYLRHPSQSDLFSPFQDFPSALEHFPAGSVIAPTIRLGESEDE
jgi:hypothetical protein